MIIDEDVESFIQDWSEAWCIPVAKGMNQGAGEGEAQDTPPQDSTEEEETNEDSAQDDSVSMLTDEEVEEEKKVQEKEKHEPKHKKRKARKNANTLNLDDEDITMIAEAIA